MTTEVIVRTRLINRLDPPGTDVCNRDGSVEGTLLAQWADFAWVLWESDRRTPPVTEQRCNVWTTEPEADLPF